MIMLKKNFKLTSAVLLLLMLLSNSNSLFAATAGQYFSDLEDEGNQQELLISSVGEDVHELFDPIIYFHKNLLFITDGNTTAKDFDACILRHTNSSISYLKRSRSISPGLGVKEVIFPFHVFL